MVETHLYLNQDIKLFYYELKNDLQPLVLLHGQGVDGRNFANVWKRLSKRYHVYSVDCYGHGGSLHDATRYNVADIGNAIICFLQDVVQQKAFLLGHSSGGLIAAYVASHSHWCNCLILEDPPFFASQGERRKHTFNYVDLSTVCHNYLSETDPGDFVLYYFRNQYAWNFFPEASREKARGKLVALAEKYRKKHPDRDLKVPFWPKAALSGFQGMNGYDPRFGETFYTDTFHAGIPHEEMIQNISCKTLFMKAKTEIGKDGLLMAALSEEDLKRIALQIPDCRFVRFDCGHGIHVEKARAFTDCLLELCKQVRVDS